MFTIHPKNSERLSIYVGIPEATRFNNRPYVVALVFKEI